MSSLSEDQVREAETCSGGVAGRSLPLSSYDRFRAGNYGSRDREKTGKRLAEAVAEGTSPAKEAQNEQDLLSNLASFFADRPRP